MLRVDYTFSEWPSPGVSLAYWLEYRYARANGAGSVPVHGIFSIFYNTTINVINLLQFCHLFSESRLSKNFRCQ